MADFLSKDTNGKATFIITVEQDDTPGIIFSASEASRPPRLVVDFIPDQYLHTRNKDVTTDGFRVLLEKEVAGEEVNIRDMSGNRTLVRFGTGNEIVVNSGPSFPLRTM